MMNDDVAVVAISADVVRLGVEGGGALYLGVLPLGYNIRMLLQTNRSLLQTDIHAMAMLVLRFGRTNLMRAAAGVC